MRDSPHNSQANVHARNTHTLRKLSGVIGHPFWQYVDSHCLGREKGIGANMVCVCVCVESVVKRLVPVDSKVFVWKDSFEMSSLRRMTRIGE